MRRVVIISTALAAALLAVHWVVERSVHQTSQTLEHVQGNAERGRYIVRLAGCVACHTDDDNQGQMLAGGRRLNTPYGIFVTPNITPDKETGIGSWNADEFYAAVTLGVSPAGDHYYPSFPYTSYTRMTRQDVADLKVYLDTVPAVRHSVPAHDLGFLGGFRAALTWWKWLYFKAGEYVSDPSRSAAWNRGAYIVQGPGHCGECHTPRNMLGGFVDPALAGTASGPDGKAVPPLAGDSALTDWTTEDLVFALQLGIKPDGDAVGGSMGEVVDEATSHLMEQDLKAVSEFLLSPRE